MKTKFKIGQQVECLMFGKGTVEKIIDNNTYSIKVLFENGRVEEYTPEGKYYQVANITLTNGTWEVKEIPEVTFEQGEPVWVKESMCGSIWHLRYYSHKNNGTHYTFVNHCNSGETVGNWDKIKKFDPNNLPPFNNE